MKRSTPSRRTAIKRKLPSYPSATARAERRAWGEGFPSCWVCGARNNLQTHEIASKAQAPLRWADQRNYFRACDLCNCDFLNWAPEAVMLALKSIHDGEHYDREFVNELRHRAANAISESDVRWWVTVLERRRAG